MILNPVIWFANREVSLVPKHFIKCPSPVNDVAKQWIINKSQGRYSFSTYLDEGEPSDDFSAILLLYSDPKSFVYFENSEDALMYNLLFSDNK